MGVGLVEPCVNHVLIAGGLHHAQVVRLLEAAYLARDAHASCQHSQQFVVTVVNLLAQERQLVLDGRARTYNQPIEDGLQRYWCNLLCAVAQGVVRIAVAFNHQAVKAYVHCQLGERFHIIPLAADV